MGRLEDLVSADTTISALQQCLIHVNSRLNEKPKPLCWPFTPFRLYFEFFVLFFFGFSALLFSSL
jgi:hypothetical protein